MFHQSLTGMRQFPPIVRLRTREQLLFTDPRHYELACVLMSSDSASYMILDPERANKGFTEFQGSIRMQMRHWLKHHEKQDFDQELKADLKALGF